MNKKHLLLSVLPYLLKEGEEIKLGNDTFLTNMLDGSDKFYGFRKDKEGFIWAIERRTTYLVAEMKVVDVDYIFNSNIFHKLVNGEYKERRVYAVANHFEIEDKHPNDWSNEQFITHAENEGLVWSLKGFEEAFNNEDVSDQWYIRII